MEQLFDECPLVSVIVITYNSSELVTETLDSIYKQTYKNIELIVSDDCSQDNTVTICKEWIRKNSKRFYSSVILSSDINTGTSANCNRGINACHGDWIRIIAGDDLMPENSISLQVDYLKIHPEIKILNGYSVSFKVEDGKRIDLLSKKICDINPSFYLETASYQYNYLLRHTNFGLTEGTIINRSVYKDICKYDEKYTIIEDLPFWLNVTRNGIKYYYINTPTLYYRIHTSVVHASDTISNKRFAELKRNIVNEMVRPYLPACSLKAQLALKLDDFIYWITFIVCNNKRSFISRLFLASLYKFRSVL